MIDIYANRVCKNGVFKSCGCDVEYLNAIGNRHLTYPEYVEGLANEESKIGLNPESFQFYINTLYSLAEADSGTLRLIASDPARGLFRILEFSSIPALCVWYTV